jgi:type IV pilus assembly protein PilA
MRTVSTQKAQLNKGFTLMEILVVIGIIAILAAIVIVAINPSRQFAQARNSQRESNVSTILNAIGQNIADNKGTFTCGSYIASTTFSTTKNIGSSTASGYVDLGCLVPTYIPTAIPFDPDGGTPADTLYTVIQDSVGRFTVCAPKHAEAAVASSSAYCLTR